jgi:hypothetical protein
MIFSVLFVLYLDFNVSGMYVWNNAHFISKGVTEVYKIFLRDTHVYQIDLL